MSKTVITAEGNDINSTFDLRFGRAGWFCILDNDSKEVTFIENEYADANHGAGTKVAEKMIELKVTKAISGDFGPKAKELLEKFNIQMVIIQENQLVKSIIDKLTT